MKPNLFFAVRKQWYDPYCSADEAKTLGVVKVDSLEELFSQSMVVAHIEGRPLNYEVKRGQSVEYLLATIVVAAHHPNRFGQLRKPFRQKALMAFPTFC